MTASNSRFLLIVGLSLVILLFILLALSAWLGWIGTPSLEVKSVKMD